VANETDDKSIETAPLTGGGDEASKVEKAPLTGDDKGEAKAAAKADESKVDAKAPDAEAAKKLEADKKAADDAFAKWSPTVPEALKKDAALSKVLTEEFKPLVKDAGLKPELAQKFVDLLVKHQTAEANRKVADLDAQQKQWIGALRTDKEFGGDEKKFIANMHVARKATMQFATPEFRTFLNSTGLEAHPEVVRFFFRVGKALAEDSVAGTSNNGADKAAKSEEALLRAAYPTMFPAES